MELTESQQRAVTTPTGAQADGTGNVVAVSFASPEDEAQCTASTAQTLRGLALNEGERSEVLPGRTLRFCFGASRRTLTQSSRPCRGRTFPLLSPA